jgi:hypothetical protein
MSTVVRDRGTSRWCATTWRVGGGARIAVKGRRWCANSGEGSTVVGLGIRLDRRRRSFRDLSEMGKNGKTGFKVDQNICVDQFGFPSAFLKFRRTVRPIFTWAPTQKLAHFYRLFHHFRRPIQNFFSVGYRPMQPNTLLRHFCSHFWQLGRRKYFRRLGRRKPVLLLYSFVSVHFAWAKPSQIASVSSPRKFFAANWAFFSSSLQGE